MNSETRQVRVLIVGCGYVGLAVGELLSKAGHQVFGLRRTGSGRRELERPAIVPLTGDITRAEDLRNLPLPFDWVVNTVSSMRGGKDEYRAVYLEGTRNLIAWLKGSPLQKYVYTSSTSVYGQTDGSVVHEQSATEPASETGRILLEAESLLLEAARTKEFPAVILRVAGIYGPERGHLFQQYLRDEATISGDPQRYINMVHRDDLAGIILAALERGQPGEIYNVSDEEPVSQLLFFTWLSQTLKKPLPPLVADPPASRKRAITNKRISNAKLKAELGYQFKYPTYREGYTAEIARLRIALG